MKGKLKTAYEGAPCPFCGGTDLAVYQFNKTHSVVCADCKSLGPSSVDVKDAVGNWNTRYIYEEVPGFEKEEVKATGIFAPPPKRGYDC